MDENKIQAIISILRVMQKKPHQFVLNTKPETVYAFLLGFDMSLKLYENLTKHGEFYDQVLEDNNFEISSAGTLGILRRKLSNDDEVSDWLIKIELTAWERFLEYIRSEKLDSLDKLTS